MGIRHRQEGSASRCALFTLVLVACGPSIVDDGERVPEFAEGSTDQAGVWAFAKVEPGWLSVYVTTSDRPSCEEPVDIGDVESGCPPRDAWVVKLFIVEPYDVPGMFVDPEPLGVSERYVTRELCGRGSGSGDDGAWLALDAVTRDEVTGQAVFTAIGRARQVAFSAPICPPEEE